MAVGLHSRGRNLTKSWPARSLVCADVHARTHQPMSVVITVKQEVRGTSVQRVIRLKAGDIR